MDLGLNFFSAQQFINDFCVKIRHLLLDCIKNVSLKCEVIVIIIPCYQYSFDYISMSEMIVKAGHITGFFLKILYQINLHGYKGFISLVNDLYKVMHL